MAPNIQASLKDVVLTVLVASKLKLDSEFWTLDAGLDGMGEYFKHDHNCSVTLIMTTV